MYPILVKLEDYLVTFHSNNLNQLYLYPLFLLLSFYCLFSFVISQILRHYILHTDGY